jgi:hypothetical protein
MTRLLRRRQTTVSAADLRLGVPWYLHPAEDPGQWAELVRQSQLGNVAFAVVNVASGPGLPGDPYYVDALSMLREQRVSLHGYVDTNYGARPLDEVQRDVQTWLELYEVEGVMFDRVSADPAHVDHYRSLAESTRLAGVRVVVGNPGTMPHPDYLETFDVCCVFENVAALHRRLTTMARPLGVPPGRLWHLVYGVPRADFDQVLLRIAEQGAGLAFVTDRAGHNPWCGLPEGLAEALDRVRTPG